jgi:hypothetical protein
MKTLSSFEFKSPVGKATHDWDAILSGKIVQLTEGEDYACKTNTIATMARNQAKKKGLAVRMSKVEGGIVIQAYQPAVNGQPASEEPTAPGGPTAPGTQPPTKSRKKK